MRINGINEFSNAYYNNYFYINNTKTNSRIVFMGQLEDDFFEASLNNDTKKQLKALSSLDFDVTAKDKNTGNNFLHVVLMNDNQTLIKKAINLLLNKKKDERIKIITAKNNSGAEPLDYVRDELIKQKLYNLCGRQLPVAQTPVEPDAADKLNELSAAEEIPETEDTFGFFDEIEETNAPGSIQTPAGAAKPIRQNQLLDDVIGLDSAKEKLNSLIIQPFKNKEFIPINGFLIYGSSGSGKTFLVESLFKAMNAEYLQVASIADFEKVLENAKENFLKTGKQTPVFIDNIDTFLPKIDNYRDNTKTTRLMQLIENSSQKGIILLAATDKMFSIEPGAISPNRFDEHIEVLPLTIEDRANLIKLHTKNIEMQEEEISDLAAISCQFSPAAIVSIIKKAKFLHKDLDYDSLKSEMVKYAADRKIDISEKSKTVIYDTFLKREVLKDYDPKSLDEVKGMETAKRTLYNTVVASFDAEKQKEYRENRINIPNGILLYGPPGCGKTYIVKAVTAQAGLPLYQIKMSEFGSKYVNETSNRLKQAFDQLRTKYKNTNEASILFFDECDSFFRNPKDNEAYKTDDLNTLKEEMNNAGRDGIIIIAATNEIQDLNDAIVRDGRFDDKIFIDLPDTEARFGLIESSLENRAKTKNLLNNMEFIKELTELTDGLSSATITSVINKAVKKAVDYNIKEVSAEDLKKAFTAKKEETLDIINKGEYRKQ